MLLEKAYAKVHGSYMALKGGLANDALFDLTGSPSFKYNLDNVPEIDIFLLDVID